MPGPFSAGVHPAASLGQPLSPGQDLGDTWARAELIARNSAVSANTVQLPFSGARAPAADALLIVAVFGRNSALASPTMTGWGLTWTLQARLNHAANTDSLWWFTANTGGAIPATNSPLFDCTGDGANELIGWMWQFLGPDSTFVPRVRQWATSQIETVLAPHAELARPPLPWNAVVVFEGNEVNNVVTPPAGFIEAGDQTAGGNSGSETAYMYPATTQPQAITWGSTLNGWRSLAVEVSMEPTPDPYEMFAPPPVDRVGIAPGMGPLVVMPQVFDVPSAPAAPTVPMQIDHRGAGRQDIVPGVTVPVTIDQRSAGRQDVNASMVVTVRADQRSGGRQDVKVPISVIIRADQRGAGHQDVVIARGIPLAIDMRGAGHQDVVVPIAVPVRADMRGAGRQDIVVPIAVVMRSDQRSAGHQDVRESNVIPIRADQRGAGHQDVRTLMAVVLRTDLRGAARQDLVLGITAAGAVPLVIDQRSAGHQDLVLKITVPIRSDQRASGRSETFLRFTVPLRADARGSGHQDARIVVAGPATAAEFGTTPGSAEFTPGLVTIEVSTSDLAGDASTSSTAGEFGTNPVTGDVG